jgi:methyl-accepting chemotaxis protein
VHFAAGASLTQRGEIETMLAQEGFLARFEKLDAHQKAALEKAGKAFSKDIERTLRAFYSSISGEPELVAILARAPNFDALIRAQRKHWETLLSGEISDEFLGRCSGIGEAHARAGLLPRHYVAAYSYFIETFVEAALGPKSRQAALAGALIRAVLIDMKQALSGYYHAIEAKASRDEAATIASSIETEVNYVERVADELALGLSGVDTGLKHAISEVSEGIRIVGGGSVANTNATSAVASALSQIQGSNAEVDGRAREMSKLAGEAAGKSANLGLWLDKLRNASQRISEITKLIDGISKQTNLLALNATIEAGRAGKSGTGFAVVAHEIKELSQHSAKAAKEIAQNIAGIQADLNPAIVIMDEIGALVQKVDATAQAVVENIAKGIGALNALSGAADEAAKGAAGQRNAVELFTAAVTDSRSAAESLGAQAAHLTGMFHGMAKRLSITVANIVDIEARHPRPIPLRIPAAINYGGQSIKAATVTISETGALLDIGGHQLPANSRIEISFPEIGKLAANVVLHQPLGVRAQFMRLGSETARALEPCIKRGEAAEERFRARLAQARDEVERAIANGIAAGKISADTLFDFHYEPIAGTTPQQVRTKSLPFLEQILPQIQEEVLKFDGKIVFCVTVDLNGYLPVHNSAFSKPQGSDPIWNFANCRNRRIYDGKTGLAAARNEQGFLTQVYFREMGGGKTHVLRDISAPVRIEGRLWGALRLGTELPGL